MGVVGVLSLTAGLVFCFAVPVLQFFALGYLLQSAGHVARTRRIRRAFWGVETAARVGSFAAAAGLLLFLFSVLVGFARDAALIDPQSASARFLGVLKYLVGAAIVAQFTIGFVRGLQWSYIFRPISNLRWLISDGWRWSFYRGQIVAALGSLRTLELPELLRLGVLAYLGSWLWLLPPSLLLLGGLREGLFRVLGIAALAYAVTMLPVMQTRFGVDRRWRVFVEGKAARELWARAPVAIFLATFAWLALGLIPYVLLIESFPYGLLWIPSVVFVATTLPARLGMAWAIGRAQGRDRRAGPWLHWPCRLLTYVAALIFSTLVFFAQHVDFRGSWILLDHPAFLFPVLK